VQDTIFKDISGVYASNLERDWKICNFHNVELRLPFAKQDIARFALGLPLELKIEPSETTLRKLVLRQVAKDIGLPEFVVNKPKKAIQYTTGVNAVLRKLAKQNGLPVKEFVKESFEEIWKR
jgi:asparagine synthase (glutamine-hydrolysing)